jgi:virginiamycin A acetyltransferase
VIFRTTGTHPSPNSLGIPPDGPPNRDRENSEKVPVGGATGPHSAINLCIDAEEGTAGAKLRVFLRNVAKRIIQGLSLVVALPLAALTAFGRISSAFQGMGQLLALVPGLPGDYLRVAFYFLTLRNCSLQSRVSYGTFFSRSCATVGRGVYIGSYCVLGACEIGERTQIATHVQILSGRHQHTRGANRRITGANIDDFESVTIGADCWIGAAAIVMADIGSQTTIGAGAVVTRAVPDNVVAVGNPARPLT